MLTSGLLRCPCCMELVTILEFWREQDDMHIHLCDKCRKLDHTQAQLLRIGFIHGQRHMIEEFKKQIGKMEI